MGKKVLVVGGGGREHALTWKIAKSQKAVEIYAAPGNPGMAALAECVEIDPKNITALADFAEEEKVDLTVVGPEDPLAMGIADLFLERGLPIFGPTRNATKLESNKAFARNLMFKAGVPSPEYQVFTSTDAARQYIEKKWGSGGRKYVVKASGLAAGKGAVVCDTREEALAAIDRIMVKREFGDAGKSVVIEERLFGPEVSMLALSDSYAIKFFPLAQDYKPVGNGDRGPNTGGMGSYSPVPVVTKEIEHAIRGDAVKKAMVAMAEYGRAFRGTVYAAEMLTPDGPKTLEFNARFGDPETQPLMMRLRSDLLPYLEACADDSLCCMPDFAVDDRAAVCVVLASGGYPGHYEKGKLITGLDDVTSGFGDEVMVFHAGTREVDGQICTNGGRVLGVTALGGTIDEAADIAYRAANMINFEGKYCRTDIGRNVLARGRV